MLTQQAATFQEALEIVESLPEDQQEDLIHTYPAAPTHRA
jgi:hypothetical protein